MTGFESRRSIRRLRTLQLRKRELYHTIAYFNAAVGVNAVNTDLSAAADTEITQRNNHYTFSEDYRLLSAALFGTSVTRGKLFAPRWNNFGELQLFSANRSATIPSNPQMDLWYPAPLQLPLEEEFQVQTSNNLGAATEEEFAILDLATADWSQNVPPGEAPVSLSLPFTAILRASFTVTPTVNAWSGGQVLTFSQSILGGVWSVIGAVVQGTNAAAWRIIFPRNRLYNGRRLRPGGIIQNAVGDNVGNQAHPWIFWRGELGRFHTFEFPVVEVFGLTAGSTTYQVFLWMRYLGQSRSILDSWVAGGS